MLSQFQAWREAKGVTQNQIASLTGISRPNISAFERGHRDITLTTLGKLALALGVSPGQLLDQSPQLFTQLNRYEIDEIAEAVVTGKRGVSIEKDRLADDVASLVINLLEAHQALGLKRVRRLSRKDSHRALVKKFLYDETTLKRIMERIPKYL